MQLPLYFMVYIIAVLSIQILIFLKHKKKTHNVEKVWQQIYQRYLYCNAQHDAKLISNLNNCNNATTK